MSKLQTINQIAQSNKLIEGRYCATKNELILLVAIISLINPKDKDFLTYSVNIDELARLLKLDRKSALREFRKIARRLAKKTVEINTKEGWEIFPWVSICSVKRNTVIVKFNNHLKPYLLDLKKNGHFTQYKLEIATRFKSNYSIRMYQLLEEYRSKRIYEFQFSLQDFKCMMLGEYSKSYPVFKDFRRKVLDMSKREFSTLDKETGLYKSDLNFDLQTRRTGRKISHLIFTIKTQQTKLAPNTKTVQTARNSSTPQIILAYEAIGVMGKTVKPYLEQRGEQALQNTLNKFNDDKAKGKITKSEQGYLAYLLRVNAGQETNQGKERKQQEKNKAQIKEKKEQEQALKVAFTEERDIALKGFFDTLEEGELEYIILDFEASELFEQRIKSWPMLFTVYNNSDKLVMQDPDIKSFFHAFVIGRHLDKALNNFGMWKEANTNRYSVST